PFDTRASHVDPAQLDSWLAVAADGRVTAYTGKCELGQGILTAQTQLVAEELSVPMDRIQIVQCDTSLCPDQGTTSGSRVTPTTFNERTLAQAAATAREALIAMASARLGVPADRLTIADGVVSASDDGTKRVSYGELVAGRQFKLAVNPRARRKKPAEWKVLGQPAPRVDMTAMVTGRLQYVHNVRVPGMLHGAVVRPPSRAATLTGVDEASVRGLPGFVKVVVRKNFVGVVFEKPWQALQGAAKLKATWAAPPLPDQSTFYDYLRRQPSRDAYVVKSADVDAQLASAASVVKATYLHPYQLHGSLGASCAVADVQGEKATVWSPTQSAYPTRSGVAAVLGIRPENVRIVFARGSGCYGINAADTVSYDAALLSQGVGRPVRVQLSRRDEALSENY